MNNPPLPQQVEDLNEAECELELLRVKEVIEELKSSPPQTGEALSVGFVNNCFDVLDREYKDAYFNLEKFSLHTDLHEVVLVEVKRLGGRSRDAVDLFKLCVQNRLPFEFFEGPVVSLLSRFLDADADDFDDYVASLYRQMTPVHREWVHNAFLLKEQRKGPDNYGDNYAPALNKAAAYIPGYKVEGDEIVNPEVTETTDTLTELAQAHLDRKDWRTADSLGNETVRAVLAPLYRSGELLSGEKVVTDADYRILTERIGADPSSKGGKYFSKATIVDNTGHDPAGVMITTESLLKTAFVDFNVRVTGDADKELDAYKLKALRGFYNFLHTRGFSSVPLKAKLALCAAYVCEVEDIGLGIHEYIFDNFVPTELWPRDRSSDPWDHVCGCIYEMHRESNVSNRQNLADTVARATLDDAFNECVENLVYFRDFEAREVSGASVPPSDPPPDHPPADGDSVETDRNRDLVKRFMELGDRAIDRANLLAEVVADPQSFDAVLTQLTSAELAPRLLREDDDTSELFSALFRTLYHEKTRDPDKVANVIYWAAVSVSEGVLSDMAKGLAERLVNSSHLNDEKRAVLQGFIDNIDRPSSVGSLWEDFLNIACEAEKEEEVERPWEWSFDAEPEAPDLTFVEWVVESLDSDLERGVNGETGVLQGVQQQMSQLRDAVATPNTDLSDTGKLLRGRAEMALIRIHAFARDRGVTIIEPEGEPAYCEDITNMTATLSNVYTLFGAVRDRDDVSYESLKVYAREITNTLDAVDGVVEEDLGGLRSVSWMALVQTDQFVDYLKERGDDFNPKLVEQFILMYSGHLDAGKKREIEGILTDALEEGGLQKLDTPETVMASLRRKWKVILPLIFAVGGGLTWAFLGDSSKEKLDKAPVSAPKEPSKGEETTTPPQTNTKPEKPKFRDLIKDVQVPRNSDGIPNF
jgi:hypothetical protein